MITTYQNTVAGRAAAYAMPSVDGKKEITCTRETVTVATGADVPDPLPASAVTLSDWQFFQAALMVGGQPLLLAIETWVADRKTTGTPTQRIYWTYGVMRARIDPEINQLRLGIIGGKSNADSLAEMDTIFNTGQRL